MIVEELTRGMKVLLPSGNVVLLVSLDGDEWTCEYTVIAKARGAVVYTVGFLQRYGALV